MKISTKGRYGLRIVMDVAMNGNEKPRMIRDIAKSQQISEKYISRLIIDLRQGGILESIRGAKGGYKLSRNPESITVLEILEIMEGRIAIVECLSSPIHCVRASKCATKEIWNNVNEEIRTTLSKITLAYIMLKQQLLDKENGILDYCI